MKIRARYAVLLLGLLHSASAMKLGDSNNLRIRQDSQSKSTAVSASSDAVVSHSTSTSESTREQTTSKTTSKITSTPQAVIVTKTVDVTKSGKEGTTYTVALTSTAPPVNPTTVTQNLASQQTDPTSTRTSLESPDATCNAGYKMCPASLNGGCCRSDFQCAVDSCVPPATVTETRTCEPNYVLCPASLGYGCCENGSQCGATNCIVTSTTPNPTASKVSDIPIRAKVSPTVVSHDSTAASGGQHTVSAVKLGGIVGGVLAGVFLLGLAFWMVKRRVKGGRGNTDPFWRRGQNGSEILGAHTRNAYDPNEPAAKRRQRTYQPVYSDASSLPSPGMSQTSSGHHDLDFGFNNPNQYGAQPPYSSQHPSQYSQQYSQQSPYVSRHPSDSKDPNIKYGGVPQESPPASAYIPDWNQGGHYAHHSPPLHQLPAEIGDPDRRSNPEVYEFEGEDRPRGSLTNNSRWSAGIARAFRRVSNGTAEPVSPVEDVHRNF